MPTTTPKTEASAPSARPDSRACILVVDDDDAIRELLADMLCGSGFRVMQAIHGRDAVERIRQTPVDLVITDLVMPEQEGLETIIKLQSEFPSLKVIAISGYQGGEFLRHASVFGACATIKKPFSIDHFMKVVASVLDDSQGGGTAPGPIPQSA